MCQSGMWHLTSDLQSVRCHSLFPVLCLSVKPSKLTTLSRLSFLTNPGLQTLHVKCFLCDKMVRTEVADQFPWLPCRTPAMSCSEHDSVVGLVCYYCNFLWLTTMLRVHTHRHTNHQTPEMFSESWRLIKQNLTKPFPLYVSMRVCLNRQKVN